MIEKRGPFGLSRPQLRRIILLLVLVTAVLALSGCAAGDNERFNTRDPANFWAGLWHGFILLFSFIISLFSDTVRIYEATNVGWGYDLGFLLGVIIFWRSNCEIIKVRRCKNSEE
jgi:hypothetical protein